MIDNEEIWKGVVGWEELYQISNKGTIRALDRMVQHSRTGTMFLRRGKMFTKGTITSAGYMTITLCNTGSMKFTKKIHQLVGQAFIRNPENKRFINHKDGNKQNNNDWNLEWSTIDENNDHALENGLNNQAGSYNRNTFFVEEDIRKIRELLTEGNSQYSIAKSYGVSQTCIQYIKTRKTWSHIN